MQHKHIHYSADATKSVIPCLYRIRWRRVKQTDHDRVTREMEIYRRRMGVKIAEVTLAHFPLLVQLKMNLNNSSGIERIVVLNSV